MELMRYSDRKLTDKIYTDSNLLPFGEVVRNLPDEENLIKILTNLPVSDRRMLTRIVERWGSLSDELKRAVLRVVG
jgi:hypothetical protein